MYNSLPSLNSRQLVFRAVFVAVGCLITFAQQPTATAQVSDGPKELVRELFVPSESIDVLLGGAAERVFMTREAFEKLSKEARQTEKVVEPFGAQILSTKYQGVIRDGRARLTGELTFEVLEEGLHEVSLTFAGVGIQSAVLDGQAASLAQQGGAVILFVTGKGRHSLQLELTLAVASDAARQTLTFQLPTAPANTFELVVPGNVEVKSGAAVVNREVNQEENVTNFDLLLSRGPMSIVMSLNNRKLRDESTVMARGVVFSEITAAYERLHATMSMNVLNGATEEFRFVVDNDLEVYSVVGEELNRWSVADVDGQQELVVNLQSPATGRVVLSVRLDRKRPQLGSWTLPEFYPQDVAGYTSVIGLVTEVRLRTSDIDPTALIPIDVSVLTSALPKSLFEQEAGKPNIEAVAAFYATNASQELSAVLALPPNQLTVAANSQFVLSDAGLSATALFSLTTENEKLFSCDILMPQSWKIESVKVDMGAEAAYETFNDEVASTQRIRVQIPAGIAPGTARTVQVYGEQIPQNWLASWETQSVELPRFSIMGADEHTGIISLAVVDDLIGNPDVSPELLLLDEKQKQEAGLNLSQDAFAFSYASNDWAATIAVSRQVPRKTALVHSFLLVQPEILTAHFELSFLVESARTKTLQFSLPDTTPVEISIRGLDGVNVKETSSSIVDNRRVWSVELAEKRSGVLRLAADFSDKMETEVKGLDLPTVRAEQVDYQSGTVSVEGHPELDMQVTQHPRTVDVGELVDADYQVGKTLLGAFGYVGTEDQTVIDVERRPVHGLPTTIVERAELFTLLSARGRQQTVVRYRLKTKAAYLEARLPTGAELWAVNLDGVPALPHRAGGEQADNTVIVALPADSSIDTRDLQIVYELTSEALHLRDHVDMYAPELFERDGGAASSAPVPTADLSWEVTLPHGYQAVKTNGIATSRFSIQWLLQKLWDAGGGKRQRERQQYIATVGSAQSLAPQSMMGGTDKEAAMEDYAQETRKRESQSALFDLDAAQQAMPQAPPLPAESQSQVPTPEFANQPPSPPVVQQRQANDPWALEGVRSLQIDLDQEASGDRVTFSNLGTRQSAGLTIVDARRFAWGGWAVALAALFFGLRIRSWTARIRYIIAVCIAAMLIPVIAGWGRELEVASECVFGAAALLAVWYATCSIVRRIAQPYRRNVAGTKIVTTSIMLLASVCIPASHGFAQSDPFGSTPLPPASQANMSAQVVTAPQQLANLLRDMLTDAGEVSIPEDAIVVPYDPANEPVVAADQQLWVPFETYQALRKQISQRDDSRNQVKPSRPYALAGVNYQVVLDGDDSLQMSGELTIDQFVAQDIFIPLHISGCVLERASLDGQPARLHLVSPQQPAAAQKVAVQTKNEAPSDPLVMLSSAGIGRKQLKFSLRFQLNKTGGWRSISATVPSAAAGMVTLTARRASTDIRFTGVEDRTVHETKAADEELTFALPREGNISLQWRDKIQGSEIDQGLTVRSRSVFDVQEDALRLAWHADFEFRRSRRESFTVTLPTDYLVERVVGANVRGWTVKQLEDTQQIDVELLKAAEQRESFAVIASKLSTYEDAKASCPLPQILVPSAMLHQGQILVRRSALLDVVTAQSEGLSRVDVPTDVSWIETLVESGPLPLKNYQAYEFSQPKIDLTLSVSLTQPQLSAETQTLLKISQRETSFETQLQITTSQRDVHHIQVKLPKTLDVFKPLVSGRFEWSLVDDDDNATLQVLNIYLANGLNGTFPVVLRGKVSTTLADGDNAPNPIDLPKFELVGAVKQDGAIVVQADPAYAVRAEALVNCESVLLDSVSSWLGANQRRLARMAIRYLNTDYSGNIRVVARTPSVSSSWLSNVKVTDRAIEETILILAKIELAGIREFTFQLPASQANARIQAPLLRRKTVTPTGNAPGDPVQVSLELQDAIMGQFMIVVEFDRLLTNATQTVPTPTIETGSTQDRFITLENASRDELVTEQQESLRKISKIEFGDNAAVQFYNSTSAEMYSVVGVEQPNLQYRTKSREAVETAGARIGLAQTLLVVDEFGGYRGTQEYRVENRTEPYLELELPLNAQLWTVTVAGEPVKPAKSAASVAPRTAVRVPLIRTAEGDLDYAVVLKYGGTLQQFGWPETTQFPFVQTTNISVELSQVRLRLPERSRWFNFDGTVGRVETESDLKAGWLSFRTRQLSELTELLGTSEKLYSKARASNNLKALNYSLSNATSQFDQSGDLNLEVKKQLEANSFAIQQAQEQIEKFEVGGPTGELLLGNRAQVAEIYSQQQNGRSYNVVDEAGQNFAVAPQASTATAEKNSEFDSQWLFRNSLDEYSAKDRVLGIAQLEERVGQTLQAESKPGSIPSQSMQLGMQSELPSSMLQPRIPQRDISGEATKQDGAKGQISGDYRKQVERYNRKLQENAPANSALGDDLFGSSIGGRSSGIQQSGNSNDSAQSAEGMAMAGSGFGGGGGMGGEMGGGMGGRGRGFAGGYGGELSQRGESTGAFNNESLSLIPNPQSFRSAAQMGNGTFGANSAAFMASLDVDLAVRGREFLFTTPGGQLELHAQSISEDSLSRVTTSLAILALGLVLLIAFRLLRKIASTRIGRVALAAFLFLIGSISLVVGLLPFYGLLCLLATLPLLLSPPGRPERQPVTAS